MKRLIFLFVWTPYLSDSSLPTFSSSNKVETIGMTSLFLQIHFDLKVKTGAKILCLR